MHIHGYPVALGVISFVIGAGLWRYKRLHRFAGVAFGAGAFFLALGVIPWLDALASLTSSGTGATVLILVDIISIFAVIFECLLKHMHHRIRTPVLMVTAGTAALATVGNGARLLRYASRSPHKTATALSQSIAQIGSGQAARAMPSHQALVILLLAAVAIVVLIVLGHHADRHSGPERRRSQGGAFALLRGSKAPAVAGKSAPAALPPGRKG